MSSPVLSTISYIFQFATLATIIANICSYFVDAFPPQVPSFLAGYDNGLLYALKPCSFLSRCQQLYGPVYRVSLGYWQLVVVSSGEAINSVLSKPSELLGNEVIHREMFYVIAGISTNFSYLHQVMVTELFPLVDRALSPRSLGETTQTFGLVLLSQIKTFVQDHKEPISLTALTNVPLYTATNLALLGSAFPADTYADFRTLSQSVPYRFTRTLLWRWPSYVARTRLLKAISEYLQRGEVAHGGDHFSSVFMKVFKDKNIQSVEGARLVLNFLWGVHSNTLSNSLFLLSFLLGDPNALARVRAEINSAVEKFGSLEALLEGGPDELDDPSFKMLTSAIMETLRLSALHIGIREAKCDFDLRVKDRTIAIKKGEFVFGDVHAAHMDSTVFPNPETFVADRFAQHPYQKKHLQTEGYLFHALGSGRHICKGRWLALYQIKVVMIILLHLFDFDPAGEDSVWRPLRVHPRSIGVIHTDDDVFVRLSPRDTTGVGL